MFFKTKQQKNMFDNLKQKIRLYLVIVFKNDFMFSKHVWQVKNYFLFFICKNRKHSIFKKYILIAFTCVFMTVLKNNYINI